MITLITGVPGAGKTLYAVSQILLPESKTERPIFVDNIPDLVPRHEIAPDVLDWPDWAPEGAHIFIDEVQRVWRPEAAGKTPHRSITELETHRHRGLDFTIMTQHPNLIHANVRRLVGKHIHVRRTALGVKVYEYSECQNSPDTAWRNALTKLSWKHPKNAFGLYKSASLHVKVKYRIPGPVKLIAACIFGIAGLGWYMADRLMTASGMIDQPEFVSTAMEGANVITSGASGGVVASSLPSKSVSQAEIADPREAFIPRVYGEPWTAPAYDSLRVVRNVPRVVACIKDADRCTCYTEQMTKIDMTQAQCRERVDQGVYDAYSDMPEAGAVASDAPASPAPVTRQS